MSLKRLSQFQVFDANGFFKAKDFMFAKIEEWQEGEDADHRQNIGTKITGVVFHDGTSYGKDIVGINKGESLTFKVYQPVSMFNSWKPFNTVFKVENFSKVTVYGDFRNQLSVKVPDLIAVSGAGSKKGA